MPKKENINQNLLDELEGFKNQLLKLENDTNKQNNSIDKQLNDYENKISLLSLELNKIKEINHKTKELLLIELESNLDIQNKNFLEQNEKLDKYGDLIQFYKENNEDKQEDIVNLSNKVGELKQIIKYNDDSISGLNDEIVSLRDSIASKDDSISGLNDEIV
ncbi:hypothetical protein, partial [uncultured Methanobrevibacter sp.]|uniref:hypothetical protein n=1 Tax=uncultured Methanobrevibacter sp. TaxID=253161 RepID=UPI00320A50D9